jgi:hypothetical protein
MFPKDTRLRPHHRNRAPSAIALLCTVVLGMGALVLLLIYASAA